jgi:predicted dehydrogenase/nucleoside-diphosphate-sugar epimerase
MNDERQLLAARETETGSATGRKRRVGLVGAGYIADWHAKSLPSVAGVELVAVCDTALSRAEALAGKYGVAKAYGSLEAMLAAEKLDAVHILTPPDLHFKAARTAIEAGVDVLLEKPMCDRVEECEELVRLAAERGVRLGVGHNFLFSEPYEQLRRDVRSGVLGPIDEVTITWNRFLPQAALGPFGIWMLRDPRNMMLETGAHSVAHMLDLVGEPEEMEVKASDATVLPTGKSFYWRWQVNAMKGRTAVQLRFRFVPGFSEYNIHVRGLLAAGTVDFERNTYTRHEHRPLDPDFENYSMVAGEAKGLKRQARRTLEKYVLSKLHMEKRGTAYGESIARAMDAFYGAGEMDPRITGSTGARVIRVCARMGELAKLPVETVAPQTAAVTVVAPQILVLGGTGFIGRELVRQLLDAGRGVRLLVRSSASLPEEIRSRVECQTGDVTHRADLLRAMDGVECVVHLARASVKSWADYQKYEIEVTRQVAECALEKGVKRLVYTGTIDSYYAGRKAGTITEATPLDPRIASRNLYARAKAESEKILLRMHREQRLPLVIVRPGIVIGRGGSPFHWGVGMWWSDSVCQIWGEGENKLPLVLVEDVAKGLIAAMDTAGIEGRSFNLVADQCLSAEEYLDELDRAGRMQIQRHATPIVKFYLLDMLKWVVKVAVRHPERRLPSYRDWESRTQKAFFDCTAAKTELGWKPVSELDALVQRGIEEPLKLILK